MIVNYYMWEYLVDYYIVLMLNLTLNRPINNKYINIA